MGMIATLAMARAKQERGAVALTGGAFVRDRLRRLARPELDRAYRLAGLILGDGSEAQDVAQDAFLRSMATLDVDERLVVVLHYWADLTAEGISARLGWPVGTVKSRLHRALTIVRRQMGSLDEAGERRG
jgi:DNA-directed RNA polymerase specialized sigma24 family protein